MTTAYSCESTKQNPYDIYDNQTLSVMAYSDATAAFELSKRIISSDFSTAYTMAIRAAALGDGDLKPIYSLYGAFGTVATNDIPNVRNLEEGYVLIELAARLGGSSKLAQTWRDMLADAEVGIERQSELDDRVEGLMHVMRDIQVEVLGETSIGVND